MRKCVLFSGLSLLALSAKADSLPFDAQKQHAISLIETCQQGYLAYQKNRSALSKALARTPIGSNSLMFEKMKKQVSQYYDDAGKLSVQLPEINRQIKDASDSLNGETNLAVISRLTGNLSDSSNQVNKESQKAWNAIEGLVYISDLKNEPSLPADIKATFEKCDKRDPVYDEIRSVKQNVANAIKNNL